MLSFRALSLVALCSLAACADETKPTLDESGLSAFDVNDDKDDSLKAPTFKGSVQMGSVVEGRVTRIRSFHAYDYVYEGQSGLVRLDLKSYVGEDLFLATYKRKNNQWQLVKFNDDCGDGSLNSCMFVDATGGTKYRFVVTTFDALVGYPIGADYELAVTCKNGDCLAPTSCGARAGDTCSDEEFCAYQPGQYCGAADAQSTCQPRPWACTQEYHPVCGCDGTTYGNACEANAAGTGVVSTGACTPP